MKILDAVKNGLGVVFAEGKIIVLIYAVNFFLTLVIAIPLYVTLHDSISDSFVRENMMSDFDNNWWDEFNNEAEDVAKSFRPSIIGIGIFFENIDLLFHGGFGRFGLILFLMGALYLTVNTFLAGGAIGLYADEKRSFTQGRFFSLCGQFFNRFFSLVFMSVILYFVVYKLLGAAVLSLTGKISGGMVAERSAFFVDLVGYILVFFLLWFVNMLFDYGKIAVVVENRESSAEALWIGVKFVFANLARTLGVYYFIGSAGAAILVILLLLSTALSQTSLITVLIAFTIYQLYIFVKIIVRLTFYSSQLALYRQGQATTRRMPKA